VDTEIREKGKKSEYYKVEGFAWKRFKREFNTEFTIAEQK
jgi:hypothetical protein